MAREVNPGIGGLDGSKKESFVEEASVVPVAKFDPLNPQAPAKPALEPVEATRSKEWAWRNKPIKCDVGGRHGLTPIARVKVHGKEKLQNLCIHHYRKLTETPDAYDATSVTQITDNPEHIRQINDEDWRATNLDPKNREAAEVFSTTKTLPVVPRTPGRPVRGDRNPDTQKAIDLAATAGGHPAKNHEELIDKAHTALVHSMNGNAGHPYYPDYVAKAKTLFSEEDHHRISAYYHHALNEHRRRTGQSAIPPVTEEEKMARLSAEAIRNPSDAPSRVQATEELFGNEGSYAGEFTSGPMAPKPRYD